MTQEKQYSMFRRNKYAALWSALPVTWIYNYPSVNATLDKSMDSFLTRLRAHEALRWAATQMDEREFVDEQDYMWQFRELYVDKSLTLLGQDTAHVIKMIANDCKYEVSRDKAITDAHLW